MPRSPFQLNRLIRQVKAQRTGAPAPRRAQLQHRLENLRNRRNSLTPQPPVNQLPWNAQAETTMGQLNRNYADTNAGLGYQEQQAQQAFGLAPGFNDPTANPFSRAALLQKSWQDARRTATNSYASGGQLYSGALSNALGQSDASYGQNFNALQGDYADTLDKISRGRLQAARTLDEGTAQAQAQSLEDALKTPVDPSEAPADPYRRTRMQLHALRQKRNALGKKKRGPLNSRIQRLLHR